MEQLRGTEVQVVLSIREGKAFDRLTNSTSIVATLNGQSLETGCIELDSKPRFTTDLVWKADKNVLRKMRSGQGILRVECFEIKGNEKKDKIGHILLSLRSARIVLPRDGDINIPSNWHKLLNLRSDMRAHKPELSLALTIEEHEAYVQRISRKEQPLDVDKDGLQDNLSTWNKVDAPYLVEEESLIQLGPVASCQCLFLLQIIAGTAKNLHLLKGETANGIGNYSLWYRVFENDVRLKTFTSLSNTWTLNEKVVIRIRSSIEVLRNYLQERPHFLLIMQYGDTILGHSEIDLRPLITPEMTEFSLKNGDNGDTLMKNRCILNKRKTPRNIGDNEDNEAFLDLQLRLIYVGSKKFDESLINDSAEIRETRAMFQQGFHPSRILPEALTEIDPHRNSCGDFDKFINGDKTMGNKILSDDLSRRENPRKFIDRIPLPRSIITATNSCNAPTHSIIVESYHCYCLNVNLIGIKLSSASWWSTSSSPTRNIEFRFHHPKAEIMTIMCSNVPIALNEKLRLQDIGWKLHFISATDKIRQLLMSFPPTISVRDAPDDTKICTTGQAILDIGLLYADDEKHESRYEAALYDNEKNEIGTIDVAIHLEDRGPDMKKNNRDTASGESEAPPIVDDSLAYKIVEELEAWKERQQEIFRYELKKKEEQHLNRLSNEWQKRRENLESKLACSVEQCKMLANSLNKATEDLRARRLKSLEKEARLIKANEDLQWRYDNNVQETRKMHEELASKVNILQEQRDNSASRIESLLIENEKLRRLTSKQANEIEACRKGALTRDQTASLLQDVKGLEQKLSNTQKSKSFFKEQWGKAVREIHRMKMEHQQAIEVQIKTSKDELKNFDLEEILGADSSALTNDQIMLDQIQKEIDIIKPKSTYVHTETSNHQSLFTPIDTVYSQREAKSRGNVTAKSEEQDERLRKLIEERDSLLKTGSYTIDDTVIVKLNAEIRSLLISN